MFFVTLALSVIAIYPVIVQAWLEMATSPLDNG